MFNWHGQMNMIRETVPLLSEQNRSDPTTENGFRNRTEQNKTKTCEEVRNEKLYSSASK